MLPITHKNDDEPEALMVEVDEQRVRTLKRADYTTGPILYWMDRDMRVSDNWALLYAKQLADKHGTHIEVAYNLVPDYLGGGLRQLSFKIGGLKEVAGILADKDIPFHLVIGDDTDQQIVDMVKERGFGALVTDFDPVRISRQWRASIKRAIDIPFYEVDAHNVVPCWVTSDKQEYAARTIRPKIHRQLDRFLTDFPHLLGQDYDGDLPDLPQWQSILDTADTDQSIPPVDWITPGEAAAKRMLKKFIGEKLSHYNTARNIPSEDGLSDLSPYLHYGQLSAQYIAKQVADAKVNGDNKDAYLEELIVRRELSDNFCSYNPHYDSLQGIPSWAQETLEAHKDDEREHIYSFEEFEQAKTHDDLWNAAQLEMVHLGKMHGYMRMYWAKKILEWTATPQTALRWSIMLNDRYELDGRDPNGYVGCMWSIGGVHDRPWFERDIFGKIRYMNRNGCERKFDVQAYIDKVLDSVERITGSRPGQQKLV